MKRRDWYGEEQPEAEHPVDGRVRAALRSIGEARRLATRIAALTARLSRTTTPEQLRLWLEIEEGRDERLRLDRAEYYNHGVERGFALSKAQGAIRKSRSSHAQPAETIRVLVLALARVTRQLK